MRGICPLPPSYNSVTDHYFELCNATIMQVTMSSVIHRTYLCTHIRVLIIKNYHTIQKFANCPKFSFKKFVVRKRKLKYAAHVYVNLWLLVDGIVSASLKYLKSKTAPKQSLPNPKWRVK